MSSINKAKEEILAISKSYQMDLDDVDLSFILHLVKITTSLMEKNDEFDTVKSDLIKKGCLSVIVATVLSNLRVLKSNAT